MDMYHLGKKFLGLALVMNFVLTGCMPTDVASTPRRLASATIGNGQTGGSNAGDGDDTLDDSDISLPPKVEIRHLIEPNLAADANYSSGTGLSGGGSYIRKLTLPKNFAGKLYVAGINISTLSAQHVKVKFNFGMNRESVTVNATVAEAPGITPQTPIKVLVLDLKDEPFRKVRLPYDLFDYNEYNFSDGDKPTQSNLDSGLYCRGLQLADDPTFEGVGACDGDQVNSDQPEEECLYAYAKVLDQGLVKETGTTKLPLLPNLGQHFSFVPGSSTPKYTQDYFAKHIYKPLADTIPTSSSNVIGSLIFSEAWTTTSSPNVSFTFPGTIWDGISVGTSKYYYRGPYRLVDKTNWQLSFPELDGKNRLFKSGSWVEYSPYLTKPLVDDSQSNPKQNKLYYNSYLFPLATKLNLGAGVVYMGSSNVEGPRLPMTSSGGETQWMDGSNARSRSRNTDQEHVGSCNVSATIEIISRDTNKVEYVIATANDVKLQLVRPTQYRTDVADEVLYTNFKSCSSNSSCGSSECCFNNRCWDQALVSQCIDATSTTGHRPVGDTCSSDFECSSLCCNSASGKCSPHNASLSTPVTCSKPAGEFCISKEWCSKSAITRALLVKLPSLPDGTAQCTQLTYVSQEYGDCKNSVCVPPTQPNITADPDLSAPGACAGAVTAPSF